MLISSCFSSTASLLSHVLLQAQHQRWVWDAVFSADSYYIITASSDQTAKLWDVSVEV